MKFVSNSGSDRVLDLVWPWLKPDHQLDIVSPVFSLFAFAEVQNLAGSLKQARLIAPPENADLALLGSPADRAARNRLQAPWLARQFATWLQNKAELRCSSGTIPQGALVMRDPTATAQQVVLGSFGFSTDGLGITPGNPLSLIQSSETPAEAVQLSQWFDAQWTALKAQPEAKDKLIAALKDLSTNRDPFSIYALILLSLFNDSEDAMDEERIVKSATGIRNTVVWKKLYKFQRDGVVGAIDKLID